LHRLLPAQPGCPRHLHRPGDRQRSCQRHHAYRAMDAVDWQLAP
jgi:hypothetical protein